MFEVHYEKNDDYEENEQEFDYDQQYDEMKMAEWDEKEREEACGFDKEIELKKLHKENKNFIKEQKILKEYDSLIEDIVNNYEKIEVVDRITSYSRNVTIFYLKKNSNFEEFKSLWNDTKVEFSNKKQYTYDSFIDKFKEKAQNFDFLELPNMTIPKGTICILYF